MNIVSGRLQVFFEAPFWVGVFEQVSEGKLSVCKVTFGAEPKDSDVLEFILIHYDKLRFSPAVDYEKQFRFELKQQKRKEKHKGR